MCSSRALDSKAPGPELKPIRTVPVNPACICRPRVFSDSASCTNCCALGNNCWPNTVSSMRRPTRSNKGWPKSCSSDWMLRDNAGWVRNKALEALA